MPPIHTQAARMWSETAIRYHVNAVICRRQHGADTADQYPTLPM